MPSRKTQFRCNAAVQLFTVSALTARCNPGQQRMGEKSLKGKAFFMGASASLLLDSHGLQVQVDIMNAISKSVIITVACV